MAHQPNLKAIVLDRIAAKVIPGAGLLVVCCVLGILVFLASVAIPLFLPARASAAVVREDKAACLAMDFVEGTSEPWWVTGEGAWRLENGSPVKVEIPGYSNSRPVAAANAGISRTTGILFDDGRFALVRVERHSGGAQAALALDEQTFSAVRPDSICAARDGEGHGKLARLAGGIVTVCGPAGLGDAVETPLSTSDTIAIALSNDAKTLAVARATGEVEIWNVEDLTEPRRTQTLPAANSRITALAFLLGDETLVTADDRGAVLGWMRVRHVTLTNSGAAEAAVLGDIVPAGKSIVVRDHDHSKHVTKDGPVRVSPGGLLFLKARTFPGLQAAATSIAASPRNKCFAAGDASGGIAVYHATTERRCVAIEPPAPRPATRVVIGGTGSELGAWHDGLRTWTIQNPYPDVTARALFASLWYESYPEPELVWQSSSGTQESEPKYSLWPLIFGTLKGTLYALLFSIPVAFAAAIYVARFAPASLRSWVKPAIELMAGIPSVVVGMVAALWLAPLAERALCGIFVGGVLFPFVFAGIVALGGRLTEKPGARPVPGLELAGALVTLLATVALATALSGPVERGIFHGDFRQWLFEKLHIHYDLRNGFMVGVALGFAVIPVVFTIAEDALANVPASMTSAALALGATRWQTVRHVILPAAASGLFAASVLGLGRAAGETMIVVMAAGNTPILDPAPWNGMRTMSAAMAIEIPEAPVGGSLYRVLFLTGLLLFGFTAALNTVAEIVGTRLRRKYGRH